MVTEPWGLYPPEVNAGRMETGVGAPAWLDSALFWTAQAAYIGEMMALLAAQTAELTGNWMGLGSAATNSGSAPFAAWLQYMETMATTNAATCYAVLEEYSTSMGAHVPLAVVIANRVAARVADLAGALGAPNAEMVTLELEYAAMWVHNAGVMSGYDIAGNLATMTKPVAPPPPLVTGLGGGMTPAASNLNSSAQQASNMASQVGQNASQSASQLMQSGTSGLYSGNGGPGTGDASLWANQLGGGAGLGMFGSGGGGSGSGSDLASGGGGAGADPVDSLEAPGLFPTETPMAAETPVATAGTMPLSGFGGIANAPTAARPVMPMMPPPVSGAGGKQKQAAQITMPAIVAATPEFPITQSITDPEQVSEETTDTVQRPL